MCCWIWNIVTIICLSFNLGTQLATISKLFLLVCSHFMWLFKVVCSYYFHNTIKYRRTMKSRRNVHSNTICITLYLTHLICMLFVHCSFRIVRITTCCICTILFHSFLRIWSYDSQLIFESLPLKLNCILFNTQKCVRWAFVYRF